MALFHLQTDLIGRSKGHSAIAAAAYRAGVRLFDERTGEVHDYGRRSGVDDAAILAPAGAEPWTQDRETLWNRAEDGRGATRCAVGPEWGPGAAARACSEDEHEARPGDC